MSDNHSQIDNSYFSEPVDTLPGLNINDLNKYLPAIRTMKDINMDVGNMFEGMFLTKCLDGMMKIPDDSIDLIIAEPPIDNWDNNTNLNQNKTLKEYYEWNQLWINESYRILKNTGSIYLLSHWKYSGMYQNLLTNTFKIQSRIIWRNQSSNDKSISWINETSDIWFATKTDDFLFKQLPVGTSTIEHLNSSVLESNLWLDIPRVTNEGGRYPQKLFNKIIGLSSFKLNWVLDPFMGIGDVGWSCKKTGRRFIGFETEKDQMLLAMKRVDNC